jgi:hypothetical protein
MNGAWFGLPLFYDSSMQGRDKCVLSHKLTSCRLRSNIEKKRRKKTAQLRKEKTILAVFLNTGHHFSLNVYIKSIL